MNLTDDEQLELEHLRWLKSKGTVPLSNDQLFRFKWLVDKEFHNCCPNPHCTGYQGNEDEIECPKCKTKLLKLI